MYLIKEIIFLLLLILSFSCQTRLEKQGWQRIAINPQFDTSTINRNDKELVIQKMHDKGSYFYQLYISEKDSTGKIINGNGFGFGNLLNSDVAYYKWESDSVCLVKLLYQGDVQASLKLSKLSDSTAQSEILDQLKK